MNITYSRAIAFSLLGLLALNAYAERKTPARIGFLAWDAASCRSEVFITALRELGHVEGRNVVIDCHHADGSYAGLAPAAAESARRRPDVIVAITHDYAEAARRVTKDIPIVMIVGGDPVAAGLVASLARPGGNITGVGHFSPELNAKRLELLKAIAPRIKRVAALSFREGPDNPSEMGGLYVRESKMAAKALGLELLIVEARGAEDLDRAFDEIARAQADALDILPNRLFAAEAQRIADLAVWHRLPTIHWYKPFPAMGGLMAYGVDYETVHRRAAVYVDKILKGAKPGELPIEQPPRFELTINLKAAHELGLNVSQSLLMRADKVIE